MKVKTKECTHHWQIAVAEGPVSKGKCKFCKATRDFQNSIYKDTFQITLPGTPAGEKEQPDATQDNKESRIKWNRWLGD